MVSGGWAARWTTRRGAPASASRFCCYTVWGKFSHPIPGIGIDAIRGTGKARCLPPAQARGRLLVVTWCNVQSVNAQQAVRWMMDVGALSRNAFGICPWPCGAGREGEVRRTAMGAAGLLSAGGLRMWFPLVSVFNERACRNRWRRRDEPEPLGPRHRSRP